MYFRRRFSSFEEFQRESFDYGDREFGKEELERVVLLEDAAVAVRRRGNNAYRLEAAVPLAAIGFAPEPGMRVRGDVGVLFSNRGGGTTVLRAYVNNQDTAIVEDLPTEARLQPHEWAPLEVK